LVYDVTGFNTVKAVNRSGCRLRQYLVWTFHKKIPKLGLGWRPKLHARMDTRESIVSPYLGVLCPFDSREPPDSNSHSPHFLMLVNNFRTKENAQRIRPGEFSG